MLIIGLTGGIGCGKSTVADLFAEYNIPIIDADQMARELTQPNQPAFAAIISHFGETILQKDRTLNRKKLRQVIFQDNKARQWLEILLHPLIKKEIENKIQLLLPATPYCILVIPLLLEVGKYSFIDRVLLIDTDRKIQIQRVMERDHLTQSEVEAVLATQMDAKERLKYADDVITNHNDRHELSQQVVELHKKYLKLASSN